MSEQEIYRTWVGLWSQKEERAKASRDATLQRLDDRRRQLSVRKLAAAPEQVCPRIRTASPALHIAGADGKSLCGLERGIVPLSFAKNPRFKVNAKSVTVRADGKVCPACKSRAFDHAVNTAEKQREDYEKALNASISGPIVGSNQAP